MEPVKCDETPGTCNNCRNMSVVCRWDERHGTRAHTPPPPRPAQSPLDSPQPEHRLPACLRCRYARSKCSKSRPACERCAAGGLDCTYPPNTNKRALTAAAASWVERQGSLNAGAGGRPAKRLYVGEPRGPTSRASLVMDDDAIFDELAPPDDVSERLIRAFFVCVHVYHAYAFLHREATLYAAAEGSLSPTILLALWAVGARFAVPAEPEARARAWAAEAARRVVSAASNSRENVVAALLLAGHAQHAGAFAQASLWCGVANRQALGLGLHRETHRDDRDQAWVEAEGDRRLYHACYCLERQMSNGAPESITCPAERVDIRLPCDGASYRLGIAIETPTAVLEADESHLPPWLFNNVGPMGLYVRIVGARFAGKAYVHALSERQQSPAGVPPGLLPWAAGAPFAACLAKLATIKNSIPPRLRLTHDHIARKHDFPGLGPLVMLYVLWNTCHLELCRIALPGYPGSLAPAELAAAPDGWLAHTRDTCLRHAKAITAILDTVTRHKPRAPLTIHDHAFPRHAHAAIRLQLEIALAQGDLVRPHEAARLKQDFAIMLAFMERTAEFYDSARLLAGAPAALDVLPGLVPADAEPTAAPWWGADTFGSWPEQDDSVLVGLPRWDDAAPLPELEPAPDAAYPQPYAAVTPAPERWQGMLAEWPVIGSDPLMPDLAYAPLVASGMGPAG
ncbi:hypothetical protein Q5752_001891 [Cryptotrichosporon argae]